MGLLQIRYGGPAQGRRCSLCNRQSPIFGFYFQLQRKAIQGRFIRVLNNYTPYNVRIGLSALKTEASALSQACRESLDALNRLFHDHNVISLHTPLPRDTVFALPDPRTLTEQLSELVQANSMDEAHELLRQYFDHFLRSGENIESLKLTSVLIYTTLTVNMGTIDTRDAWNEQTDEQFYLAVESARTVRNIYDALTRYLERYITLKQNSPAVKNNLIRQVNAFMHTSSAENINLQVIADMFHVSCGYLGRLYRRETGESLIIALNRRRIEVAKRLLRTISQKVFEIAHNVGIDDPTYFTHIFVKYTGQSPSAYRNDG